MIQQEELIINNKKFIHTWSNEGYYIVNQNGVEYGEAFDRVSKLRPAPTYIEATKLIDSDNIIDEQ